MMSQNDAGCFLSLVEDVSTRKLAEVVFKAREGLAVLHEWV